MIRSIYHAVAISIVTLLFGGGAILTMILFPTGDPLLWFARPWALTITGLCRTRVHVSGAERIPPGRPCVYMSNHQSHFDILALVLALPGQYRILAKRGLFWIPVFGWALWLAGCIPVDRQRRDRAFLSIDRAVEAVRRGRSILIFAEGTRSEDGRLLPLKKGGFVLAIRSGAPIVPISIRGSREILPKGGKTIRTGTIEVAISEPIESAHHTMETMDDLLGKVRAAIGAGLAPPVTAPAT